MLILDGAVRQLPPEQRSTHHALVQQRMRAQERCSRLSGSRARPQIEGSGNTRRFDPANDRPTSAIQLTVRSPR
jgi:hypothetical protein